MIIVAGSLHVAPTDRDRYLRAVLDVAHQARRFPGCLDFAQSPDPNDSGRINVYERWESQDALLTFRGSGTDDGAPDVPQILAADVATYEVTALDEA